MVGVAQKQKKKNLMVGLAQKRKINYNGGGGTKTTK
jgi:hypothetical protein